MQLHQQAGEFNGQTAMGDGILKARQLLVGTGGSDEGYSRYGARPTMVLMTDGLTNQKPGNWSLPSDFNWAQWTDYDGDGSANFSTNDAYKKYAFWEATEAVKRGITIHTIALGADADRELLAAIAFAGGGVFIDVPAHTSISDMEEQLSAAFSQIAAKVPSAQLLYED
jgi:Mg-chelatase subunit ChlD